MVNIIWVALTIIGLIFAVINGRMDEMNEAIFKSANEAVTLCIGLVSVLVFWLGMMRIAQEAGLLDKLAKTLQAFCEAAVPGSTRRPSGHGIYFEQYDGEYVRTWECCNPTWD